MNIVHAWAYLPDLARAFVLAAERRADLSVFETLHFPGRSPTGRELLECIERSARRVGLLRQGSTLHRGGMPWAFLRVAGLVVPMFRELAEMRYLWNVPHRLAGERLSFPSRHRAGHAIGRCDGCDAAGTVQERREMS